MHLSEWGRQYHAVLIDKLVKLDVSMIVFDVFFGRESEDANVVKYDEQLAKTIKRAERVVLAQEVAEYSADNGLLNGIQLASPVPLLANDAVGLAPFPLPKAQVRVRQFWTFFDPINNVPTIPVVALQRYVLSRIGHADFMALLRAAGLQQDVPKPINAPNELRKLIMTLRDRMQDPGFYNRFLNVLRTHDFSPNDLAILIALANLYQQSQYPFFNYYGPPVTIPVISYQDFWNESSQIKNKLDKLKDTVVFVGAVGLVSSSEDEFDTVFTEPDGVKLNGVEMVATAFANLLQQQTLRYPTNLVTVVLIVALGVFLVVLVTATPSGSQHTMGRYRIRAGLSRRCPCSVQILPILVTFVYSLITSNNGIGDRIIIAKRCHSRGT